MGELASALDSVGALAADDLFGLSDAALLDRTRDLVGLRNMLDAELARTTRRAELAQAAEHDGLKSMKTWLRTHGRLSRLGGHQPDPGRPRAGTPAGDGRRLRRRADHRRPGRAARPDHHP